MPASTKSLSIRNDNIYCRPIIEPFYISNHDEACIHDDVYKLQEHNTTVFFEDTLCTLTFVLCTLPQY